MNGEKPISSEEEQYSTYCRRKDKKYSRQTGIRKGGREGNHQGNRVWKRQWQQQQQGGKRIEEEGYRAQQAQAREEEREEKRRITEEEEEERERKKKTKKKAKKRTRRTRKAFYTLAFPSIRLLFFSGFTFYPPYAHSISLSRPLLHSRTRSLTH